MSLVAVVGGGDVGLPTAGVIARFGHDVGCTERVVMRLSALSGRARCSSPSPYEACRGAQVLAVPTECQELRGLDFAKVAGLMHWHRIVDDGLSRTIEWLRSHLAGQRG